MTVENFFISAPMADFSPSRLFKGSRDGYYFGSGPHGLGYYRDSKQSSTRNKRSAQPSTVSETASSKAGALKRIKREETPTAVALAEASHETVEELSPTHVKKMLLQFEKRINNNQLLRVKHVNNPAKFVDSEVDLDESLQKLHELASAPEYYSLIIKNGSHVSILGLLTHDNTDICLDVIALLYELTDPDVVAELGSEEASLFVDALIDNSMFELLVQVCV